MILDPLLIALSGFGASPAVVLAIALSGFADGGAITPPPGGTGGTQHAGHGITNYVAPEKRRNDDEEVLLLLLV